MSEVESNHTAQADEGQELECNIVEEIAKIANDIDSEQKEGWMAEVVHEAMDQIVKDTTGEDAQSEDRDLIEVAQDEVKSEQSLHTSPADIVSTTETKDQSEKPEDKASAVGTSTTTITETPEVSSTRDDNPPRLTKSSRRSSYNSRGYMGGYQNYGLTYLPYKSNFEPSEDARRRADEFIKTLKL